MGKEAFVLLIVVFVLIISLGLVSAAKKDYVSGILIYDEKPVSNVKLASESFSKLKLDRIKEIKALSKEIEIKYQYHIFDGIQIKIPKDDLSKLNKIKAKFYPSRELKLVLHESVPQINADVLHSLGFDGAGVKVAVTDTGVDYNHPALVGKINPSDITQCYAFINNGEESTDCFDGHGHGTHVFGTIASQDNYYKGVAPGADMMAIRVFEADRGYDADLVRAIEYAVDNGADVVSMSVVTIVDPEVCLMDPEVPCTCYDTPISLASDNAVAAGVVTVGGSGNEYRVDGVEAPACSNDTIAVGAVDKSDNYADFSSGGEDLDLVAPGVGIWSTLLGGGFGGPDWMGTSMATPHVSGVVALLLEADITLTPKQIKNLLRLTAVDLGNFGFDVYYGYGRVDAYAAYDALINPVPEYITTNAYKDSAYTSKSRFFEINDVVYIEAEVTDLIWRAIPGLVVETKIYFNNVLLETIPLSHQGGGVYRGSFNSVGHDAGVYNLSVQASNANGVLSESSQIHFYPGSGVSAYYMDLGSLDYIIENQHLINVFNQEQAEGPLKYLIQKEDMLFYNFLDSGQGTSRGGIHSTSPLNVIHTSSALGEGLIEANINYNVIALTGVSFNPPLDSTPKSCVDQWGYCNGCTDNTVDGCTSYGCTGDETIDAVRVNGTIFQPGDLVKVEADIYINPYWVTLANVAVSYNNGSGWVNKYYGTSKYGGYETIEYEFKLGNNPGVHHIRVSVGLGAGGDNLGPYTCTGDAWGDNDDVSITVAEKILSGEDSADLKITMKDGADYLIYKLNNFNENFPNFFFSDVIGTLGNSMDDDRYHLQDGTDDLMSSLTPNLWRDFSSDYIAVYDNSIFDNVNDNVLSFVRFDETINIDFNKIGALNENNKGGSRIKYQTPDVLSSDEVNYFLVFTKGSWQDIDDDMIDVSQGILPISFYDFTCVNGETKLCSSQLGVCQGSYQTCVGERWLGCTADNYGVGYEASETRCDGFDNDCDGSIDEGCAIIDSDGDGVINVWDDCPGTPPGSFVNNRGCSGGGCGSLPGDVNNDCKVNILDLAAVGMHFGEVC